MRFRLFRFGTPAGPQPAMEHNSRMPASTSGSASSPPVCMTVAGFDPSSGAGITADLKTLAAHGIYGVAAITALTVQSTQGVRALEPVAPIWLRQTMDCLAADVALAGVKIGMLSRAGLAAEVDHFLRQRPELRDHTVLDPVLRSSSGTALLDREGLAVVQERLLGAIGWITPNRSELALLTGLGVESREEIAVAAARLVEMAASAGNAGLNVIVTGGDLEPPDDYVLIREQGTWLAGDRVETTSTHGTGCAFSTALAATLIHSLGRGLAGIDAVQSAKRYVRVGLEAAYPLGRGHGPIHHLFDFQPRWPR